MGWVAGVLGKAYGVLEIQPGAQTLFRYFEKRPVMRWSLPSESRPGVGTLDGVLPLGAQVEMQQRAGAAQTNRERVGNGQGAKLDPVLRAHLGLDAFGERRDA